MIFVDNFIHGDLHSGNWKIIVDKNSKVKIVFFDTAVYFKINNIESLRKIFYYNITENREDEIYSIISFLELDNKYKKYDLVKEFINCDNKRYQS